MANENGNGSPPSRRVSTPEDELREDTRIIARGHRDAAELYALLKSRNETISRLVEDFGPGDCEGARRALQRFTEYSHRLLTTQFGDLKETP